MRSGTRAAVERRFLADRPAVIHARSGRADARCPRPPASRRRPPPRRSARRRPDARGTRRAAARSSRAHARSIASAEGAGRPLPSCPSIRAAIPVAARMRQGGDGSAMVEQLSEAERADALDGLPDWDYDEGRDAITRIDRLHRFRRGVRLHDAGRADRRKGRSPSRMDQRVEPRRDHADDARCRRPVATRHRTCRTRSTRSSTADRRSRRSLPEAKRRRSFDRYCAPDSLPARLAPAPSRRWARLSSNAVVACRSIGRENR